jgi:predicted nucleotidyltransferase component of viral defense system
MTSRQIKDLLKNMSKKTGIGAHILQRNYMLERLLERISLSEYKNNFILKGGMLIAAIVGLDTRSTMDLDASIKDTALSEKNIRIIFESIVAMDIGDNIVMSIKDINEIRMEFEYSCFRISMEAKVDNTIIPMKVDISTGDVITPIETIYKFNLLLEKRTIEIWAYNLETVLGNIKKIIDQLTQVSKQTLLQ